MTAKNTENGHVWITFYFLANLGLTLHNKWVLQKLQFDFPWLLTVIHIGISGIGASFMVSKMVCVPPKLTGKERMHMILFSLLYTLNIAISNVSLNYVSLAFHQIVRSATPAFTVILELLILRKQKSLLIYLSLFPVIVGVCLTTFGEYSQINFDVLGCFLTIFGVVLSALKGITTNMLLVGSLKLHPLDLLSRMAPLAVFQCVIYAYYFGEFEGLGRFITDATIDKTLMDLISPSRSVFIKLLLNGGLAFFLNWVSFTANKKTSALSMTVAGNVKQAISIILAVYIFNTTVTAMNATGIFITLVGGTWYSAISYQTVSKKSSIILSNSSSQPPNENHLLLPQKQSDTAKQI